MNRREFIGCAAATLVTGCAGVRSAAGGGGTPSAYAVAILGDTHFDAEPDSTYHSNYRNEGKPEWLWKVQRKEFARNGEMWRTRCRELVAASARIVRERPGTDFILQLGDIIQGDCDDAATHVRMLQDAIRTIRAPYPEGLPFLTVVGNHDFRGEGAKDAYFGFIEPFLKKELGAASPVRYPVFPFRRGPDLWIFCHFESEELAEIIRLIEEGADARHIFLVTHGPFTPGESVNWRWRLGGSEQAGLSSRRRLMDALLAHHVIVISGHTHQVAWWRVANDRGSYAEVTVNSVWSAPEHATAEPRTATPADYGNETLAQLETKGETQRAEEYRADIAPFKQDLTDYFFNRGAGHFRLNVTEERVDLEYYPGAALAPARTFRLK